MHHADEVMSYTATSGLVGERGDNMDKCDRLQSGVV
jgi:hypothetical protein